MSDSEHECRARYRWALRTQVIPAVSAQTYERAEARYLAQHREQRVDAGQRTLARHLAVSHHLVETGHRHAGLGRGVALKLLAAAVREGGGRVIGLGPSTFAVPGLSADLNGAPTYAIGQWPTVRAADAEAQPRAGDVLVIVDGDLILHLYPEQMAAVIDEAAATGAVVRIIGDPDRLR
ncbi:AAA family ATPase [Streptomyces sp. NPDC056672]|uniref:AAA family ATPase n=1 Tax=Streptomyces sp. NPDC056672 TaxID=3345906 RepID=UPI0036891777